MLNSIRNASRGWIVKCLLGLLVISFAVWGVNDVFTGFSTTAVATVGDEPIPVARYELALDQKVREFSQRIGQPIGRSEAAKYGLDVQALSELIGLTAFDIGAREAGIAVSDDAVATNITSDPSFAGALGKFDRGGFNMMTQRMGITEKAFIEDRRNYLVRLQLNQAMEAGIEVPDAMLNSIMTYQSETRRAAYIIVPPEAVGDIADPSDDVLKAYYDKAAVRFTTPETRDFTVAVLSPDDLAKTISVSDAELQATYEARRDEFDLPERRVVDQIPFSTEDAAKAADVRLRGGEPMDKIVQELGLKLDDVALGNVSRKQMLSAELADVAFALKPGEYSEPVKGPLGYVILHVSTITSAVPSTFEETKDKLKTMIALEQAHDQLYDVQNSIEDTRAGGGSLEDVADKNQLTLSKFKGLTAGGVDLDGNKPDNFPAYRDLMNRVYENEPGDLIPPGDNGEGGYFWVRVDQVTPAVLKPYDDVKDEVVKLWKDETRKAKLQELALSLAERGNKGESIDKIAASIGRAALSSPRIQRGSENETFSRVAVTKLFAQPKNGFTTGPVGYGDAMIVMQVSDVQVPELDKTSEDAQTLHETLDNALQTDILMTMISGYERSLGTVVNTQLMQQLREGGGL